MQQHTTDLAGRLRWGAIALAAAATITVGGQVAAESTALSPGAAAPEQADAAPVDPYQRCLRSGSASADRLEARAAECRLRLEARYSDPVYVDCLRTVGATADTMERWVTVCLVKTRP
jgi:hypothetical protein